MINIHKYSVFKDCETTLRETSKDDSEPNNIVYMTNDMRKVVDFDLVKTKYTNKLGLSEEVAKSVDALYDAKCKDIFIEFKNGKIKGKNASIKEKVRTSLLLFYDITGKNAAYTRDNGEFVLVYNKEKNTDIERVKESSVQKSTSREEIAGIVHKLAKEEFVRFGMDSFKGLFFGDVHTYTETEFEQYLSEI